MIAEAEICDNSTPVYYSRKEPLKAKYTGIASGSFDEMVLGNVALSTKWH